MSDMVHGLWMISLIWSCDLNGMVGYQSGMVMAW